MIVTNVKKNLGGGGNKNNEMQPKNSRGAFYYNFFLMGHTY